MPIIPAPPEVFPYATGNYPAGGNTWSATPRRQPAGQEAVAAGGLTPNLRSDAQTLAETTARLSDYVIWALQHGDAGLFGDGSDGDVVDSANRTLDRVYYYDNWTIDSGAVVTTAGYPVFVLDTLTIDGVGSELEWNGPAAAGSVGGVGLVSTVLLGGGAGGDGAIGAANPVAGGDSTNSVAAGAGGDGGDGGGGNPAEVGGTTTLADADTRSTDVAMRGSTIRQGVLTALTAGSGGGGGGAGGNPGVDGGGGGAAGGHMLVVARSIFLQNGGALNTIGGAGGPGIDGVAFDGGGGGGGGQGGLLYLIYRLYSDIIGIGGTKSAAGGIGGIGGPSLAIVGVDGLPGDDGQIITIPG